jgi:hypothetical protein
MYQIVPQSMPRELLSRQNSRHDSGQKIANGALTNTQVTTPAVVVCTNSRQRPVRTATANSAPSSRSG